MGNITACVPTIPGRERLFARAVKSTAGMPVSVSHGTGQIEDAYANWWRAIDGARTEWVILLFDDDWLEPDFEARVAPILEERPSVVIVNSWLEHVDGRREHLSPTCLPERVESLAVARWIVEALPLTITPATVVMRREFARRWLWPGGLPGGSTPVPNAGCDAIMVLGALLAAKTAAWVPERLVHLDANDQSTTIRELARDNGADLIRSYEIAKATWMRLTTSCAST